MKKRVVSLIVCLFMVLPIVTSSSFALQSNLQLDLDLRKVLADKKVHALSKPKVDAKKAALGRLLFWDKILSGNKNISCATCHLPAAATSDALPLSMGEGGKGRMVNRTPPQDKDGHPVFVRRNSLDIFNRGRFDVMFWDGRLASRIESGQLNDIAHELLAAGKFVSPAGFSLPDGLDSLLAAQAMFPPTSDREMRGNLYENELGSYGEWEFESIWSTLIKRLLSYEEYRQAFAEAYPDLKINELSFVHAANALAAFEIDTFTLYDSPFDHYLQGDNTALTVDQKQGALLFYSKAGCANCHAGSLMTDQKFHNRIVPQIGPGARHLPGGGADGTWDAGRGGATGRSMDYFKFRTPPLRNVAHTGPWMHDGAFSTLEATVRHELDPIDSAKTYLPSKHLSEVYAETYRPNQTDVIISKSDAKEVAAVNLNEEEISWLLSFLRSLTSESLDSLEQSTPKEVPSGLPVAD